MTPVEYNVPMKRSLFNQAMDLSDGTFAYHLCGVMIAIHEGGGMCPDPEAEALRYLEVYYPEALAKEDADENTSSNPLEWS